MFKYACTCDFRFSDSPEEFDRHEGPKVNYSRSDRKGGIHIFPSELMLGDAINEPNIGHGEYRGHKVIFTHTEKADLPYDVISACFFMISRYEEYLPFKEDAHGRFPLTGNLSLKLGFHHLPMVHYWLEDLIQAIRANYPSFSCEPNTFRFEPTFDIDNAYAFIHKNALRTYGGLFKSLLKGLNELKFRLRVLQRRKADPYDTYEYIRKVNEAHGTKPIFFLLMASDSKFDRNIHPKSKAMKQLIGTLLEFGKIGIHPSYKSNKDQRHLKKEIELLSDIQSSSITHSRQHYLKLRMPDTYEHLINLGIEHDYTMGFSEDLGFRSGLTVPYPFFNVKTNSERPLMIHPFAFMESSFRYHKKFSIEEIQHALEHCMAEVKKVQGTFIGVWHNESLGNWNEWKGWRSIFEFMYENATKD